MEMKYYYEQMDTFKFYVKWDNGKNVTFNIGMIDTDIAVTSIDCDNHFTEHASFTEAFNHIVKRWIEEL